MSLTFFQVPSASSLPAASSQRIALTCAFIDRTNTRMTSRSCSPLCRKTSPASKCDRGEVLRRCRVGNRSRRQPVPPGQIAVVHVQVVLIDPRGRIGAVDQSNGGLTLLIQEPLAGVSGLGTDGSPVSIVNDRLLGCCCSSPLHPSPNVERVRTIRGYRRSRARSCNKRRPRTRIHLPLITRNPALTICRRTPGKVGVVS